MAAPSNSARSTQVFIKVAEWSTEHYTLTKGGEYDCYGSGRFTKAAPHNLDPGNDYNYTVESNGFATGVTDCLVRARPRAREARARVTPHAHRALTGVVPRALASGRASRLPRRGRRQAEFTADDMVRPGHGAARRAAAPASRVRRAAREQASGARARTRGPQLLPRPLRPSAAPARRRAA